MARKRNPDGKPAARPIVADFELWNEVTRSVTPLERKTTRRQALLSQTSGPKLPVNEPTVPAAAPSRQTLPPAQPVQQRGRKSAPGAPLTGLDRRTSQRLTRGIMKIDERIDLHGESAQTARIRLKGFLQQARARGARTVLVITGKGGSQFTRHTLHGSTHFHSPERQGTLRRLITQWFLEREFAEHVSGFQPAHPKHGGGGAFYVRLRRADRPPQRS